MATDALELRLESSDFDCQHLQIARLAGREAISRLFSFDVEIVCLEPGELDPDAVVGSEATLVFEQAGEVLRSVHGMIAEVEDLLGTETAFRGYRLRLVPRAFRLSLVETQEVFMDVSVPDLIQQKLELVGLGSSDVELRLVGAYPPREFVVQYRETDLAFISRLTEHLGISYFVEHAGGQDRLIFTDHPAGFRAVEGGSEIPFRPRGEARDVFDLTFTTRVLPKTYVLQDYDYRTPWLELTSSHKLPAGYAGGVVEYGAHFKTPEEGEALARIRAEERQALSRGYKGQSDRPAFAAGATIHLDGHPRLAHRDLLLVEVEHRATQPVVLHGSGGAEGERSYVSTFRAVDARATYRPPRVTPKPRINGVITGVIESDPPGENSHHAHIDEQGRYAVRFDFDTAPPDQRRRASLPIRMIQPHAGPNYGIHFPLRPGAEVAVTFVDGDPDRPLIQGAVHNAVTPSPVTRRTSLVSKIETGSGIFIAMKDL